MNKEKEYKWTNDDQQTFNKNIIKRIQELEDKRPSKLDDQIDIKLMKQEEFNEKVLIRLDQEIENRTKAFEEIEKLKEKIDLLERYTIKGIESEIRDTVYKSSTKSERHDDILTVHRNEIDNLKKDNNAMKQVINNYLMVNLDNPEYVTQVHEKRGNHGTSNTKGEKPRWMWILWRRHRRRHKILSSTQILLRRVELAI